MIVCDNPSAESWAGGEAQGTLAAVAGGRLLGHEVPHCFICGRLVRKGAATGQNRAPRAVSSRGPRASHGPLPRMRMPLVTGKSVVEQAPRYWLWSCIPCWSEREELFCNNLYELQQVFEIRGDYRATLVNRVIQILENLGIPGAALRGQPVAGNPANRGLRSRRRALALESSARLAQIVTEELGIQESVCLSCLRPCHRPGGTSRAQQRVMDQEGAHLTRGHLTPSSNREVLRRYWMPQCRQCNNSQDRLSIAEWLDQLADAGDSRAAPVGRMVAVLRLLGLTDLDLGVSRQGSKCDGS